MRTPMSGAPTARRAANSHALDKAARGGFVAKGLVYALIGLLALQVATGDSQQADQNGALAAVAEKPGGTLVLWLMVVGFVGYALWRFSEAAWGHRGEPDDKKRLAKQVISTVNGLIYLVFAWLCFATVTSSSSAGGGGRSMTAKVLEWPGGQALVLTVGLVVIGVAVALTVRGLRTDFEEDLDTGRMPSQLFTAARWLGLVGYVARGAVFGIIGALVVKAALDHQPGKATGFDVALKSLASAPFGTVLLMVVAVGLVCFGVFCVLEARYRRL